MMDALLAEGNYSYGEGIFLKKKKKRRNTSYLREEIFDRDRDSGQVD